MAVLPSLAAFVSVLMSQVWSPACTLEGNAPVLPPMLPPPVTVIVAEPVVVYALVQLPEKLLSSSALS